MFSDWIIQKREGFVVGLEVTNLIFLNRISSPLCFHFTAAFLPYRGNFLANYTFFPKTFGISVTAKFKATLCAVLIVSGVSCVFVASS